MAEEAGHLIGLHADDRLWTSCSSNGPRVVAERTPGRWRIPPASGSDGRIVQTHQPPGALLSIAVQRAVQSLRRKPVRQLFLGTVRIVNAHEGVICHGVADALRCQLTRQPAMTVAVELQPERAIRGHPKVLVPRRNIPVAELRVRYRFLLSPKTVALRAQLCRAVPRCSHAPGGVCAVAPSGEDWPDRVRPSSGNSTGRANWRPSTSWDLPSSRAAYQEGNRRGQRF